jgi:hypothetical protein
VASHDQPPDLTKRADAWRPKRAFASNEVHDPEDFSVDVEFAGPGSENLTPTEKSSR